ncbi:MAG TPA: hypothetical protein VI077_11445 [Pseudolabrys sp.]
MRYIAVLLGTLLSVVVGATADARPKRAHNVIVCDERGCSDRGVQVRGVEARAAAVATDANGTVVSHRPAGCPRAYCGCEASLYLFGRIRADLNLAANWMRKFPRTAPAPGMAAVRNHHVMVLMNHVEGSNWLVHDGNSGGGLTREHVVSIKGYVVVNPRGA